MAGVAQRMLYPQESLLSGSLKNPRPLRGNFPEGPCQKGMCAENILGAQQKTGLKPPSPGGG